LASYRAREGRREAHTSSEPGARVLGDGLRVATGRRLRLIVGIDKRIGGAVEDGLSAREVVIQSLGARDSLHGVNDALRGYRVREGSNVTRETERSSRALLQAGADAFS
jgi:hypothetical protein